MSKADWGVKRKCAACGMFFYDMKKEEFKCPKCGIEYKAADFLEAHMQAVLKNAKKDKTFVENDMTEDELINTVMKDDIFLTDDENDDLVEDASELGDDSQDMDDVVEGVEDIDTDEI